MCLSQQCSGFLILKQSWQQAVEMFKKSQDLNALYHETSLVCILFSIEMLVKKSKSINFFYLFLTAFMPDLLNFIKSFFTYKMP